MRIFQEWSSLLVSKTDWHILSLGWDELAQYKRIAAEQTLQLTVLKDVIEKKL